MAVTGSSRARPRSARSPIRSALTSAPPRRISRGDRVRKRFELLASHRAAAGRPHEPSKQLAAIEALRAAVALDHVDRQLLRPLVGGEAIAAAGALAAAADRVARVGQAGVDHAGRVEGAVGTAHRSILLDLVLDSCLEPQHLVVFADSGAYRQPCHTELMARAQSQRGDLRPPAGPALAGGGAYGLLGCDGEEERRARRKPDGLHPRGRRLRAHAGADRGPLLPRRQQAAAATSPRAGRACRCCST